MKHFSQFGGTSWLVSRLCRSALAVRTHPVFSGVLRHFSLIASTVGLYELSRAEVGYQKVA
jgi:hypothetical protein